MPSKSKLQAQLLKNGVNPAFIQEIIDIPYKKDINPKQDFANYAYEALKKCEKVLDFDTLSIVMYEQSCCRTGKLDKITRDFGKEHKEKPLKEKIESLRSVY